MKPHTLSSLLSLAATEEGRQQIRESVADLCAWKHYGCTGCASSPCVCNEWISEQSDFMPSNLPDYAHSLDAMAEALKDKGEDFMEGYGAHMYDSYRADYCARERSESQLDYVIRMEHRPDAWRWAVAFILTQQQATTDSTDKV